MQPQQPHASTPGARLETLLTSEVTLVPFPPGSYRIAVGGMEHPSKTVVETSFPAVAVMVLPGCRAAARLDTADGIVAWLQRPGDQSLLTVDNPGGVLLFTTYRPSDYATTGIRMDIERLKADAPAQPAPFAQNTHQPAGAPAFAPGAPAYPAPSPRAFPRPTPNPPSRPFSPREAGPSRSPAASASSSPRRSPPCRLLSPSRRPVFP